MTQIISHFRYAWFLLLLLQSLVRGFNRSLFDLGSSVHVRVTFEELDRMSFLDFQDIMLSNVQRESVGLRDSIVYRDLDPSQNNGPLGYQALVLFDFSPRDSTPASLLDTVISHDPWKVFPQEIFGASNVTFVGVLECSPLCGDHGMRVPRYTEATNTAACTCQCDSGWDTDTNQVFESFKYCSIQSESIQSPPIQNTVDGSWRPPVAMYPPPPPKTYEDKSSGKLPLFKWAIIGASIIVIAIVVFILCKTRCCGLCSACCQCCCTPKRQISAYQIPKQYIVHPVQPPINPHVYSYEHPLPNHQQHALSPLGQGTFQANQTSKKVYY